MKNCAFTECNRDAKVRGFCKAHYEQQRQGRKLTSLGARCLRGSLDNRIIKSEGCWEWSGATRDGYGVVKIGGRPVGAHRAVLASVIGPISPSLMVDHKCHNTLCVNPDHLQAVTNKLNQENRKSAQANNTAGIRGVHKNGNRWRARAKHNGVDISAGSYATAAEAESAAIALRNRIFSNNLLDPRDP